MRAQRKSGRFLKPWKLGQQIHSLKQGPGSTSIRADLARELWAWRHLILKNPAHCFCSSSRASFSRRHVLFRVRRAASSTSSVFIPPLPLASIPADPTGFVDVLLSPLFFFISRNTLPPAASKVALCLRKLRRLCNQYCWPPPTYSVHFPRAHHVVLCAVILGFAPPSFYYSLSEVKAVSHRWRWALLLAAGSKPFELEI